MTPTEITAIRESWGLSRREFGQVLGLQGAPANIYETVARWERGATQITGPAARVIECIQRHPELLVELSISHDAA